MWAFEIVRSTWPRLEINVESGPQASEYWQPTTAVNARPGTHREMMVLGTPQERQARNVCDWIVGVN
jgi:hypothetical protein